MPAENQNILSLIEGPNNEVWYTTIEGVKAFKRNHEPIAAPFTIQGWVATRQDNRVPMLFRDQLQRIWMNIGTDVFRYDDGAFHLACTLPDAPRDIIALSNGRTLVSTNFGMFELLIDYAHTVNVKTPEEFEAYRETPFETMYEDVHGQFYVSRNSQSLLVFRPEQNRFSLVLEINDLGDCNAFLRKQGSDSLFICIETGVILLDTRTLRYRCLQETPDGLPAELYYSLIPDDNGSIWLSGNKGLVRYHPARHTYQRFTRADGLPSMEFKPDAYLHSSAGEAW
jgi:ligand-binding sensor domain-containing protein